MDGCLQYSMRGRIHVLFLRRHSMKSDCFVLYKTQWICYDK